MARTVYGNLTGQAARTQLAEDRAYMLESMYRETTAKQEEIIKLMACLKILQGDEFVKWWDEEVPPMTQDQQIATLKAELETARKGVDLLALAAERAARGWFWSANLIKQLAKGG